MTMRRKADPELLHFQWNISGLGGIELRKRDELSLPPPSPINKKILCVVYFSL